MTDSFYIGAYWASRAEPLLQIVNEILLTIKRLSEVDEQFSDWYEKGFSRKQALEKKVILNNETIERLCLQTVKRGELNEKGFAKMGFLFSLWTGHSEGESSTISFSVGGSYNNVNLSNSVVIKMPFEGAARERLLHIEKAKKIIALLVDIWHPDYAVLTSHELGDKLNVGNKIGWITYGKSIHRIPKISEEVIHEKYKNDGHLFYLKLPNSNSYDYNLANELLPLKEVIAAQLT